MNNANSVDILMVASLSTFVIAGLITAGMASAIVTGAVIGGIYMLTK
ncbi:hypothetical protein [Pseudoalteromonas sp. MMG024]|nr:hypothetical protein [Pseudoalteromonas sp. MMG024]MCF6458600.1 hypothetical protein [Pseudoalteromonas sp. MMG024]